MVCLLIKLMVNYRSYIWSDKEKRIISCKARLRLRLLKEFFVSISKIDYESLFSKAALND